ncbi:kinesin-II 95 kDa subunit [Xylariaceae sp. FL0804]|nr:kinesin-II 95 kDa subunit [Xylariaceae sp. FL0804]
MSVRVVARIRPLLDNELDRDIIVRAAASDEAGPSNMVKIPNPKNEAEEFSFAFNGVYDRATTQEELYAAEVAPHLKSLFQGLDVTIFAYGVTGTGKTHTMRGGLRLAERGVIPRLLSGVFRRAKKLTRNSRGGGTGTTTAVAVALSYYEIYNDRVYDLLEPPERRTAAGLPLRAEAGGRTVVAGLTERPCGDLRDFERLYIEANQHRVTAATKLNAHSSRSHAVLRVKLTQTTTTTTTTTKAAGAADVVTTRESTASAIDLAGSEDNRRTDNGRERLVESAAINKSLFVLSQCIDAMARGERRVPFRESKMTRVLSLGQNRGVVVMILNLAPLRAYHLDTLSSLNVSSRAKRIAVREIENEVFYKQQPPPRALALAAAGGGPGTGTGMARQPLRPLANAHNIGIHAAAASSSNPGKAPSDRPVKAFSVYADKSKAAAVVPPSRAANTAVKRSPQRHNKRPSDSDAGGGGGIRPAKLTRPKAAHTNKAPSRPAASTASAPASSSISAEQIEAMVEKKVSEILASRTQEQQQLQQSQSQSQPPPQQSDAAPPSAEISEEVQKRLEALERRIESRDGNGNGGRGGSGSGAGSGSDGLRFLLAARQHKERGEDAAALRMYERALPFFPGQARLLGKMEKLRARIAAAAAAAGAEEPPMQTDTMPMMTSTTATVKSPGRRQRGRRGTPRKNASRLENELEEDDDHNDNKDNDDDDDEYNGGAEADDDEDDEDGGHASGAMSPAGPKSKHRRGPPKTKKPSSSSSLQRPRLDIEADDDDDEAAPRLLLDVVNSRDAARIVGLQGFGPKKARDLVDRLARMDEDEDEEEGAEAEAEGKGAGGGRRKIIIQSLAQLRRLPGMGGRTVDRACEGLAAAKGA